MLSYRRETELQGALVLAKSGRLGDNILRTLYSSEVRFYTENGRFAVLSHPLGVKGNGQCSP